MLTEVLLAVFAGAVVAIVAKLGTGHRSRGAFLFAGLVGGFGGLIGLFTTRMIGISRERERDPVVLTICAAFGLVITLIYAVLSRIARRRAVKRGESRPSIAF